MSKKEANTVLSSEETERVQRLFSQYHHIAELLRTSLDQEQAQMALTIVSDLTQTAQVAFVKSLAKENETDAADILIGINTFSQLKEVRKEARRGLLRLESSKVRPQWKPSTKDTPAAQVSTSKPPRFWKGFVSQTREEGEIQLLLCWEQGFEYNEVHLFSFVLNYWEDGVKAFFIQVGNKRTINERVNELRTRLPNNAVVDCTLAEGKRLIEEALSVNAWRNVEPSQDYSKHLPILNQLIFQATDLGADSGNTFITPEQETQEVLVNFLGAWTFGDFGLAYDLLTPDCEIRDNLPRDEWIKEHQQWYQEAKPLRMELGFVHDIPAQQGALWVPLSVSRTLEKKDVEVGWSVELLDTPLSGTLKELPFGTVINKETGRSWFWTSYSLIRLNNAWRIQTVVDKGLALQGATTDDLQKRIKEQEETLEQFIQQQKQSPNPNLETFLETISWRLTQLLYFYDTLITLLPLDYQICKQAYRNSVLTGDSERKMVYLERITQRFTEDRAENLRRLGTALAIVGDLDTQRDMDTRANHLLKRAEETLREAISIDEDALSHMLLGELLISVGRHAEAETELLIAKERPHTEEVEARIEAALGGIAMERDQMAEAITHYQRVSALDPHYHEIWFHLGFAHRLLGQMDEAEQYYLRAIEVDPEDTRPYGELTMIYGNREDLDKAVDLLERGLRTLPSSAILHALIASTLNEQGNRREAQRHLATAESINPELQLVKLVKEQMEV